MPAQKAADVLATKAQYADPFTALLQGLRANALHLTGDARRDLDGIVLHTDTADPSRAVFLGTWQGRLRLYGGLEVVGVEAELVLLATKGSTEVDLANPQFGMSGPEIGNSVLIAAVFHVAIFYLRASGLLVMKNQPYDARVRSEEHTSELQSQSNLVCRI